jgi:cytochrome P450
MDPEVWGPDVALYRPERWLEEDNPAQHVSPYSYMPFSRGPRDCIGSKFALLEAKTILSMIYRQFEFEYAGTKPEEVMMKVTAHPRFGVPLRVRWRDGAPAKQHYSTSCARGSSDSTRSTRLSHEMDDRKVAVAR